MIFFGDGVEPGQLHRWKGILPGGSSRKRDGDRGAAVVGCGAIDDLPILERFAMLELGGPADIRRRYIVEASGAGDLDDQRVAATGICSRGSEPVLDMPFADEAGEGGR